MEIISVEFDDNMLLDLNGQKISIHPMREQDPNVIKVGINAPKSVVVNREEVHHLKKRQEQKAKRRELVTGKVKWFDEKRGMGFATVKGIDKDIFIHYKQFKNRNDTQDLWEGDKISFEIRKTFDGFKGEHIELCLMA